ncbi:MAG: twin-arginine translocase subunit TatC [bacterium]
MKDEPKTFLEHLGELRIRLIISAIAVTLGTTVSFIFNRRLFDLSSGLLTMPLRLHPNDIISAILNLIQKMGIGRSTIDLLLLFFRSQTSTSTVITLFAAAPMEKFMVVFKASFIVGTILAAPIVLYEIWAFVLPALKKNEKQYILPLFIVTLLFFSVGAGFAFFIVAPISMPVLASLLPSVQNQWRIEHYFSFVAWLVISFGVAFELPVVMGFVSKLGIMNAKVFKKQRRIAVVLIFLASAILTPTQDPFTMSLMAFPLIGLYELGIKFAVLMGSQNIKELNG